MGAAKPHPSVLSQPDYYLKVKGAKQGWFPGTSKSQQGETDTHSWAWSVASPRDPGTGQASGKRQYSPIKVLFDLGKVSPLFFQACTNNEPLPEVYLSCYRFDSKSGYVKYYSLKLTDARVSKYSETAGASEDAQSTAPVMFSEVEFTFDGIQLDYGGPGGNTMASDSWGGGKV